MQYQDLTTTGIVRRFSRSCVKMTWQRSFLYRMTVFLTFFHPVCFNNSRSKLDDPGPAQKENVKCITTQIEDDLMIQSLTDFSEPDKRQKNPVIERRVAEGTNFTYECCGNLTKKAIFKWGLYKRGEVSPWRSFSRVKLAMVDPFCSVFWTPEFKNSTYFGRTFAEYNTSSECVLWILSNLTREDENIFVAAVRDNFAQGHGFRECTPVYLNVFKANTPVPTTPPLQTTPVTTQKPAETHVSTIPTLQTTPVTTQKPDETHVSTIPTLQATPVTTQKPDETHVSTIPTLQTTPVTTQKAEPSATTQEPTSTTTRVLTPTSNSSPPNEILEWLLPLIVSLVIVIVIVIVIAAVICFKRWRKWKDQWDKIIDKFRPPDERRRRTQIQ